MGRHVVLKPIKCRCGKVFQPSSSKRKHCSRKCYFASRVGIFHSIDKTFWSKVKKTNGCWLWRGPVDKKGYGKCFYIRRNMMAHRAAYEMLKGPIPEGLEIDHKCRVRNCVNPDHLEPVTHAINIKRSPFSRKIACKRGHPFTKENTMIGKNGGRWCRTCQRMFGKRDYEKHREKRLAKQRKRYRESHPNSQSRVKSP